MGPEEDGYGQAVGMCWNGAGLPKVFARFFGRLSSGKPDGFGRLELEEGGIYMGAVANGKQHGMGQLTCPNGDRYWGTWEAGCFGQVGGGVGVWHFAGEDQAVHGLWYTAQRGRRASVCMPTSRTSVRCSRQRTPSGATLRSPDGRRSCVASSSTTSLKAKAPGLSATSW